MALATRASWTSPATGDTVYETTPKRMAAYNGTGWDTFFGRIAAKLRRVATQNIASSATTSVAISWDTEDQDTDGGITTPSTTYTVPTGLAGLYMGVANGSLSAPPGSRGYIEFVAGGRTFRSPINQNEDTASAICLMDLAVGNTVAVNVLQLSGGTLTFTGAMTLVRLTI
jgi:hypothetical protein